jgi:hypothetical protein
MLLLILAASGFVYHFSICVMGQIFGGCNCCVAVDELVTALLLSLSRWQLEWWGCPLVRFGSNCSCLRSLWSPGLLLLKGEENVYEKKWEVSRNISLATSQDGMNGSQLACHIQGQSCDTWLYVIRTVPWQTLSGLNIVCLFTDIHRSEWQLKYHVWYLCSGHSLMAWTPYDLCLKTSPGSEINHMLTINSWCLYSMTIHNQVAHKMQILLSCCLSNLPTLTFKMQLAFMWSISCNIQHFAQQQG